MGMLAKLRFTLEDMSKYNRLLSNQNILFELKVFQALLDLLKNIADKKELMEL